MHELAASCAHAQAIIPNSQEQVYIKYTDSSKLQVPTSISVLVFLASQQHLSRLPSTSCTEVMTSVQLYGLEVMKCPSCYIHFINPEMSP